MPATPYELFGNTAVAIVTAGGQSALTSDNSFTVAVTSLGPFPSASNAASPPTQFRIADPFQPSEMMTVTNVAGNTWTVTRGAEGTTPVAHAPNWTAREVTTAGVLQGFQDFLTKGCQPYYQTGTFTPSATINTYGTPVTLTPPSGYRYFMPLHIYVQGLSLAAGETLTVLGAGTLEDGTGPAGDTLTLQAVGYPTGSGSSAGVVESVLLMAGFAATTNNNPGQTIYGGGGKRLASYALSVKSGNTGSGASVNYAWWAMLIL